MEWETVIGLEVHVQLKTNSKIFSGAPTAYGATPNHQACGIDLALPGVLPMLNREAVRMAIKLGLAISGEVALTSAFSRKHYFYPDLPKGYQISQDSRPIIKKGELTITLDDGKQQLIRITRAHLEEDAGKSLHEDFHGMSGLDFNRAGSPLLEIVSEPELRSAQEAVAYLKTLHTLVRYLEICDGNMQEGSFRCDANVSVRPKGQKEFGTRTEIKNINSFRFVERAIEYEAERQIDEISAGNTIQQETRLFDAQRGVTRSMRSKENAHDYRYFPDPDLLPLQISQEEIDELKASLPELPQEKLARFQKDYGLSAYDANVLASSRKLARYFESTCEAAKPAPAKLVTNWVMGELSAALNEHALSILDSPVTPEQLAQLVLRIHDETISGKIAKTVFSALWNKDASTVDEIIEKQGLKQVTDTSEIQAMIEKVMADHPEQLTQYREGKDKLFGFFVGQVMKASKGKANPKQLNDLLKKLLAGDSE